MAKYVVAGTLSSFHEEHRDSIGGKPDSSRHVRDSVEESIQHLFTYVADNGNPLDPLEFMVNLDGYVLYTLSDDFTIESVMGLDEYIGQGGSLTFQPENLNNSDQKPEGSA